MHVFQAPMDEKLIKQLHRHDSIKSILSLSGLSLEGIFSNCYLEIPKEYEPGLGWLIVWNPTVFTIKDEHQDLIQMILKFALSYSGITINERLKAFFERELMMFEAGMKLLALRRQKRSAGQRKRKWKALDNWILKKLKTKLKTKKKWTVKDLWSALPESHDGKKIYRSESKIYCSKDKRKPITIRGFSDHVREVRKKIKYG